MTEFEDFLKNYKPTKKDQLDLACDILAESERIIADASGRYEEYEEYRKYSGDSWLLRRDYKNQYDSIIELCDSWLKKISAETKPIGCSYLVLFPEIPAVKSVYIDPLEKLNRYIDAVKKTTARMRPVLDELQKQELLPKKDLTTSKTVIISQPQFKNNSLYIGEHKIPFRKNTLNWCMLKAVFKNRTSENGASPQDIFELVDKELAQNIDIPEKEAHRYYAVRDKINKRISQKTGINDDFIEVNNTYYTINKDFGL